MYSKLKDNKMIHKRFEYPCLLACTVSYIDPDQVVSLSIFRINLFFTLKDCLSIIHREVSTTHHLIS